MEPATIFTTNIDAATLTNTDYRRVLYTGKLQVVLMSLDADEEIGEEVHDTHDQFFRIEQGQAKFVINDQEFILGKDEVIVVPAGAKHNVINIGNHELKLYTIYAPAQHPAGTIQATKPAND